MSQALITTTFTAAVSGGSKAQSVLPVAATTGMVASTPAGGGTVLFCDGEIMLVTAVNSSELLVTVERGYAGTKALNHSNAAIVWVGDPGLFPQYNPGVVGNNSGRYRFFTVPGLQTSLTALGNSTTDTAGGIFVADLIVSRYFPSTGGAVLNGATVGTDLNLVALYDYAGNLVTQSAGAGAVTAGASAFQQRAWVTPIVLAPGQYFLAYQTNGTTDNFQTIKTATWVEVLTATQTGTFGTLPAISVPTTFTANQGPIGYIY